MKLSLNWLKEYVSLPQELSLEQLAYDLTMKTVEVEGWEDLGKKYENIVVGVIEKIEDHPDADKLKVCYVDVAENEPYQIVCGGSNLKESQKVVVSKPGSYVLWHGEGEAIKLKVSKVRGVESYGMICGANEVGLMDFFPPKDDHEIVDLENIDCKAGDNVADVLFLNDCVIEIDNKSLTNRPDLYCHYGIARELAAMFGAELKALPELKLPDKLNKVEMSIEDKLSCRRCTAAVFEGLKPVQSPMWLKSALTKIGMRPINAIVDITNYVNLAVGQPSHAYDKSHIEGSFVIRPAREGETLELLDGEVLNLNPKNLLISDDKKAIGLAGIMGGKHDSIGSETSEVLLEIANFSDTCVRHTLKQFDLRTEASIRYEKNLDTARIDGALALSMDLFAQIFPQSKLIAYNDVKNVDTGTKTVDVSIDFLERRTGRTMSANAVSSTLKSLGFEVKAGSNEDSLVVSAPTWRSTGDISIKDDILEEVSRMIGYDSFETQHPTVVLGSAINQIHHDLDRRLREYLAFRAGFREIYTYPWVSDAYIQASGLTCEKPVKLTNPPAPDQATIRYSLVPGTLAAIESNLRYFDSFKVFELTQVFEYTGDKSMPAQKRQLCAACVGKDAETVFFDLKGAVEGLNTYASMAPIYFEQRQKPTWADKDAWLSIMLRGKQIGSLGLLSIKSMALAGIKHANCALFELDVEKLIPNKSRTNKFTHLPSYPLAEQDLSVLVKDEVKWSDIEKIISKNVDSLVFMDEYRGKQIPEGMKSIMFRIKFGSEKGTMTSEEIEAKTSQVLNKLASGVGADLRSL